MIGRLIRCKAVGASFWDFSGLYLFKKYFRATWPVKKMVNWRFFPPYPRKVGQRDGGASLHLVCVMFLPFSYRHVPSTLWNWQVEQGRISFIGSFFFARVSSFCCPHSRYVLGSILWVPGCSLPVRKAPARTASRVVLDFILVLLKEP